jgi:drug/metabolite transporter (DMT)-like permease
MKQKLIPQSQMAQAALLMIVAVLFFTLMDATAKELSQRHHPIQVIWARYFFQLVLTFVLLAPRLRKLMVTKHLKMQMVRSLFLFGGTMGFFTSIALMPLAAATAIFEVAPLIITVAAYFILGEHVGPRRIVAVLLGLTGAMVIIRPGTDAFTPVAILPMFAAACYAGYAISSRVLGASEDQWTNFIYTGLIGTIIITIMVPFVWQNPSLTDWFLFCLIGLLGMIAHLLLLRAFLLGEASFVAPFAYVSMAFSAIWGFVFFAEVPDIYVFIGASIIIGAGLFIWYVESRDNKKKTGLEQAIDRS